MVTSGGEAHARGDCNSSRQCFFQIRNNDTHSRFMGFDKQKRIAFIVPKTLPGIMLDSGRNLRGASQTMIINNHAWVSDFVVAVNQRGTASSVHRHIRTTDGIFCMSSYKLRGNDKTRLIHRNWMWFHKLQKCVCRTMSNLPNHKTITCDFVCIISFVSFSEVCQRRNYFDPSTSDEDIPPIDL